jgi:hypothetical protein
MALVTVTLPPASVMFASPAIDGGFDMANWGALLPSMFSRARRAPWGTRNG